MARKADAKRAEIIEFWRTVEMFSPQSVEKASRDRLVAAVKPGEPLPWEPGHEFARRRLGKNQTWRHVVYLGIYRLDAIFETISRFFEPGLDSFDERPAGESAVAMFLVDENGKALLDSEVLSSCAWATGQVLSRGRRSRDWLRGFEDAAERFSKAWGDEVIEEIVPPVDDNSPPTVYRRVLDHARLRACLAAATAPAGISEALSCTEIRIKSQIVARRTADSGRGHEFLNSFITGDLEWVAGRAAKGDIGAALREYLRPEAEIPTAARVDVRAQPGAVLPATAPDRVPAGRWLSHPDHALGLNQQLAVNTALEMTGAGVMGVNGPPGTGKTTMLRDLIAALVVRRAQRLATLSHPRKAFTGKQLRWTTGQRTRVVSEWRPDLTGFEMVVASTNNGAVENVTDEIPDADAIDDSWRDKAAVVDYFPEIATALLAPDAPASEPEAEAAEQRAEESTHTKAWALVAARLGNKINRTRFLNAFWYQAHDEPADDQNWRGMLAVLKDYEQRPPEQRWSAAVAEFRTVEARAESLRAERAEVYRAVERRARMDGELTNSRRAVAAAGERIDRIRERHQRALRVERERQAEADQVASTRRAEAERIAQQRMASAERMVRSWEAELSQRWHAHAQHQQSRPGLWERLKTLGAAASRWARQDGWLASEVGVAQHEMRAAQQEVAAAAHALAAPVAQPAYEPLLAARREVAQTEREVSAATRAQADAARDLRNLEAEIIAVDGLLDRAATAFGRHYPDATWWKERERRELTALWTDKEWNLARGEMFLAALRLHKAFLRHMPTEMRRNLQAAMDLVSGDVPDDVPQQATLAAWRSLFFVVPVVSTTFASYARLFGHLGKESLGWLLIDEAGQATPQNAVGALWRTKRAVVVGDPLQLEPITALPFRAEQAIRNDFGVDEQWLASRTSVQRLADRLTPLGTWLSDEDDSTWVGVPLTVHRRCDQPMFDIVNAIAYDGLMIDGTGQSAAERFDAAYPTLPPSKWIDVSGGAAQGHWIPDEGRHLDRILDTLADLQFDMSEVMVIAPFRAIARQVSGRSRRYPGLIAGTVHTAQGKQADIVILVLGSDPQRPGARQWAASKPNLLNVAVSRAKRRLYVIGDRRAWAPQRHFSVLAANLPHTTPGKTQ
ncbi:AAA domain-containing protein [Micromonospora sp. CPCC 206061]|uniref:AAA domain-containing protein n=1 Tax=Micromonospora sp. CPCC 206061 TaxID=3122410 RepID=UPI002FF1B2A9